MSHAYARPLPGGRRAGASTVQLLVAAAEAGEAEMVPRRKECFALERSLLRLVAALTKEDLSGADASAVHAAALSLVSAKSAFSLNAAADLIALSSVACLVEQTLRPRQLRPACSAGTARWRSRWRTARRRLRC